MANKIGGIVTHFARSERSLIVAIMVIVGLMSGVLSNTGTAAVLIPVVIGIAAKSGYARSKLLMPLVFAAAMGGNLSLIGAPGNLIAQSALGEIGMSFGFFEYAIVGLPILAAGILFYATLGMKLLPNHPVSDDDSFSGEQDFSNVPKWKQVLSLVILVLTLLGMIFEKQIGIKPVSYTHLGQRGQIAFSAEILCKTVVGRADGEHHFTLVLCFGILRSVLCPDFLCHAESRPRLGPACIKSVSYTHLHPDS